MIVNSSQFLNVGSGTTVFIGAASGFCVLLVVFFLYFNKRWCFGGESKSFACEEAITLSTDHRLTMGNQHLFQHHLRQPNSAFIKSYSLDSPESSSDSELDVVRRLQQSASFHQGQKLTSFAQFQHYQNAIPRSFSGNTPLLQTCNVSAQLNTTHYGLCGGQDDKSRLLSNNSSCCSSATSSVQNGTLPPLHSSQLHLLQMANHRAIEQNLRETKIENFGDAARNLAAKHQKLVGSSSVEGANYSTHTYYNNQDCIVTMNQETIDDMDTQSICTATNTEVDVSDNRDLKCGQLEVALLYDAPMRKMTVHVLQAKEIPAGDRGQPANTQIRLLLLPHKKQKLKTKIRFGDNPQYMESFLLHRINPEDVNSMGLRFRVYACERMRRERLIGEAIVSFSSLDLELENTLWLTLEPRASVHHSHHRRSVSSAALFDISRGAPGDIRSLCRSDSTGSAQSMQQHSGVPELLVGLAFNATTGRLSVEIVKGSHFRSLAMSRAPDSYVKLCLVNSNGQEMARSKTSVRKGQPNPLFKETFIFQVALFQVGDVTLMISVYNRKGVTKRKEMIGWFSLGLNSSGTEELAHWNDMKDLHAQQLCRWHALVDS